jgi:hypothetical protein
LILAEELDSFVDENCWYGKDDEENESNPENFHRKFADKSMPLHSMKV